MWQILKRFEIFDTLKSSGIKKQRGNKIKWN